MGEVYRARDPNRARGGDQGAARCGGDESRIGCVGSSGSQSRRHLNHPLHLDCPRRWDPRRDTLRGHGAARRGDASGGARPPDSDGAPGVGWSVQIAQGLAAAHRKGIVHRDLKPENLFLTKDGRTKILDFGLAKLGSKAEARKHSGDGRGVRRRPGVRLGTVAYMSPEQVRAEAVDHRSDLFSFGVVLYELLARENPFRRETVMATPTAILHESPGELSRRQTGSRSGWRGSSSAVWTRGGKSVFSLRMIWRPRSSRLQAGAPQRHSRSVAERSPYPGLSSFTEEDAGHFFGREKSSGALGEASEAATFALIGPSGAGRRRSCGRAWWPCDPRAGRRS